MENPKSSIGIAKWGAACTSCAVAKAKCIRSDQDPESKCDRCHSLRKECLAQVHKPRKKRRRKNSPPQIDKSLRASNGVSGSVSTSNTTESHRARETLTRPGNGSSVTGRTASTYGDQARFNGRTQPLGLTIHKINSLGAKSCACNGLYDANDAIPQESDEALLDYFVNQTCHGFPFVILEPGTTPTDLQASRPFLLQVIRMASSIRSLRCMKGQCCVILRHLSEAVYVNHQRSLDLLQGVLVLLASYHNLCALHHEFNSIIQMATSMLGDLGLNRSPILPHWAKFAMREPEETTPRTNEERRITAGVWYMSSNASMSFNKVDAPRYNKYIDECLQRLIDAKEYESDELLVALVRIQYLTERIYQLSLKNQMPDELPGLPAFPASVHFPVLQTEVEKLWSSLPEKIKNHYIIITHFDTARLRLYEVALTDKSLIYGISGPLDQLTLTTAPALDMVHRAHMALKTWLDHWLSVPVCYYFGMPQPLFTMLFYGITMLCRWMKSFHAETHSLQATTSVGSAGETPVQAAATISSLPDLASTTDAVNQAHKPASAKGNLRAYVQSRPELQLDVPSILMAMMHRCEAARPEIQAARGGIWENNTYDLAARKLKLTRDRLQWWCGMSPATSAETPVLQTTGAVDEAEAVENHAIGAKAQGNEEGWTEVASGDPLLDANLVNFQWMNELDGIGLGSGALFDETGDWSNIFNYD